MGPTFSHTHYVPTYPPYFSDHPAEPCQNVAILTIPYKPLPSPVHTTLPLDLDTDAGKRVCQQILWDMGRFWLGQSVEYLAFYERDW